MKEQLLLLLELQTIDSRVQELRVEIDALPAKLGTAKRDLARLEDLLGGEKSRLAEHEAWRREQEALIQLEDEAIRKAKAKLQAAKSTKDYTAASRELENKRKSKSEREEEVLKVMEALEKSRAQVQAQEADISALRARVDAEEEKVMGIIAELEAEAAERASGRDDLIARLEPSLLRRYEHVLKRRGVAVVCVVDGVCGGCHMSLPPQLNNQLARLDNIESCPRCGRLLYRQDFLEPEPQEGLGSAAVKEG